MYSSSSPVFQLELLAVFPVKNQGRVGRTEPHCRPAVMVVRLVDDADGEAVRPGMTAPRSVGRAGGDPWPGVGPDRYVVAARTLRGEHQGRAFAQAGAGVRRVRYQIAAGVVDPVDHRVVERIAPGSAQGHQVPHRAAQVAGPVPVDVVETLNLARAEGAVRCGARCACGVIVCFRLEEPQGVLVVRPRMALDANEVPSGRVTGRKQDMPASGGESCSLEISHRLVGADGTLARSRSPP